MQGSPSYSQSNSAPLVLCDDVSSSKSVGACMASTALAPGKRVFLKIHQPLMLGKNGYSSMGPEGLPKASPYLYYCIGQNSLPLRLLVWIKRRDPNQVIYCDFSAGYFGSPALARCLAWWGFKLAIICFCGVHVMAYSDISLQYKKPWQCRGVNGRILGCAPMMDSFQGKYVT